MSKKNATGRSRVPWEQPLVTVALVATVLAAALLAANSSLAQVAVDPATLSPLRAAYHEQQQQRAESGAAPRVRSGTHWGVAPLASEHILRGGGGAGRSTDLYNGLALGGFYWFYVPGSYWALDDGTMGPAAVSVGGGQVNAYEFAFGLHADFDGDTLQPVVFITLWNAPLDPVGGASDPVVDPLAPVSSVMVIFSPITLPAEGDYVFTSGLLDLAAAGLEFNLDETFYVEILPAKLHSGIPVLDPNVFAVFSVGPIILGANQDNMWSESWIRQGGCDIPGDLVFPTPDGFYNHPAEMDEGGCPGWENQSPIRLVGTECPGPILELSINEPDDLCVQPSQPVTVTLSMSCIPGLVRGYQAFLSFDASPPGLTFVSGAYILPDPFGLPILDPITAVGGDIDLAAGVDDAAGQPPTSSTADLVTLNFLAGTTEGLTQVVFRTNDPPTQFSDDFGNPVVPVLVNSPAILVDGTPPLITDCPPDMIVNADAGTCAEATGVDPGWATATDGLDPNPPLIEYKRSDYANWNEGLLDPYPQGNTTITWRATDCAGNFAECLQTITVSDESELLVNVALSPTVATPLTRCITFELWECPGTAPDAIVSQEITFTGGLATGVTVLVPCGDYTCITARDELHTLRRTLLDPDFTISGTQYVADFVTPAKDLIGGNLNDDYWIDILDFGVFSWEWGACYGAGCPGTPDGDTTCSTAFPHADIGGDGAVGTGDFTFIQINFLLGHEPNCCGQPGFRAGEEGGGPITEISVRELRRLGLGHLAVGDLNNDGWLNQADIVAFMQGARPKPRPTGEKQVPVPRTER